jgi:radical SAM superfamily enzyme YgiQ (UPF0313 family)
MKITFVTPTPPGVAAFGVRSLSAFLRNKGYETNLIFLPGSIGLLKEGGRFIYQYQKVIIDQIIELCHGTDLIGISFMTNYFDRSMQITTELKRHLDIPVIWGGIHPSTKPEEALEYADMVGLGEGETALLELAEKIESGRDYYNTQGIWFKHKGEIIRNNINPLIKNLDSLPHFDFSNKGHFILNKESGRIELLNDELFKKAMPLLPSCNGDLKMAFRTITDRGCPHHCTYCHVSSIKKLYKKDKTPYLRTRSPENVIDELVRIKNRFRFIEVLQFFDDTFFVRSLKHIERFSELYREKIGLPFYCQASPSTLTEAKLNALLDAGLVYVEMGIQTGSKRIRDLYRRKESNEEILKATRMLHAYRDRLITPDYHIIIDNPWETENDRLETAKLLYQVPKPYGLCISSLVLYPKTHLYEKGVKEGIIKDEVKDIYRKPFYVPPSRSYLNFLIYLFTFQHFPKRIIAFLMRDNIIKKLSEMKLSNVYKLLYIVGEALRLLVKGVKALMRGDLQRISMYFKRLIQRDPVVAGRKR